MLNFSDSSLNQGITRKETPLLPLFSAFLECPHNPHRRHPQSAQSNPPATPSRHIRQDASSAAPPASSISIRCPPFSTQPREEYWRAPAHQRLAVSRPGPYPLHVTYLTNANQSRRHPLLLPGP